MIEKKKLVVLTGAGISAESGVPTFRDSNGLWEGHNVMDVASPEGFRRNSKLVLDFYNQRRRQLHQVSPNLAHLILAELEQWFDVEIITQNVDDLHERAGSSNILHLHGELMKVRSTVDHKYIVGWTTDLLPSDRDPNGNALRPNIVWFGEEVPALQQAVELMMDADIVAIIGTSLQVYPAAGLIDFAPAETVFYYIDPNPAPIRGVQNEVIILAEPATIGVQLLKEKLLGLSNSL